MDIIKEWQIVNTSDGCVVMENKVALEAWRSIMKKRIWSYVAVLCLLAASLAGCAKTEGVTGQTEVPKETESEALWETETETGYIPDTDDGEPETFQAAETEPEESETEKLEEPEQEAGKDYQLDIKTMALEIGSDETSMTVVWEHTYPEGEVIRLFKAADPDTYVDFPGTLETSADNKVKNYVAHITGLEPETQYGYKAGREDEWTRTYYFTTKPDVADFQFLAAGDPQIGASEESAADGRAWEKALQYMTEQTGESNFIFSLGDQVEDRNNPYQFEVFMEPEQVKRTPVATLVGNHDVGSPYYSQFFVMPNQDAKKRGQPTNMEEGAADYSFTYGDTLFLCLNTNDMNNRNHIAFMTETIENYVQEHGKRPNWIIAAMHHSIFSITDHLEGKNYQARQEALAPAFSELGVDVVLMGHDHAHDRTYMMNGTTPHVVKNEDGSRPTEVKAQAGEVVYFTLNSATGSKFYEQVKIGDMIAFNNQEEVPNITKVMVRDDKIIFTTCRVEENCTVLEEFTLLHK